MTTTYRIFPWAGEDGTDYVIMSREDGESPVFVETHQSRRFAEYRVASLVENDWIATLPWENGILRQKTFAWAIEERYGSTIGYLEGDGRHTFKIRGTELWLTYTWHYHDTLATSVIEVAYVN